MTRIQDHRRSFTNRDLSIRQRRVRVFAGALLATGLIVSAAPMSGASDPTGTIAEYTIPTAASNPNAMAVGPDGNVWFTEYGGNKVAKVTPTGSFTEYPVPTAAGNPNAMAVGPDGNLWFTEFSGNKVAKVTTTGSFTEYTIPTASSAPRGITAGPDGNVWFTEVIGKVAKVTTTGLFTEYTVPTAVSGPNGITAGPDGNLWFTEYYGNKVATVTTTGSFTEYTIPTTNSQPYGITAGPDGNIWFTEYNGNKVAKVGSGFVPPATTGFLRVATSPAVPSQISIDGHVADTWGLNWLKIAPGSHQVCFSDVTGYTSAACQTVTLVTGATTVVTGTFALRGYVKVVTSPAVASQISIDGYPSDDWGVYTDLPAGSHQICFGAVAGHNPPPCQTVAVTGGVTSTVTGTFTANAAAKGQTGLGMLRVTTSPAVPSQISIDGHIADTWGLNWLEISTGSHLICYSHIPGYTTPPCAAVNVTVGATTAIAGTFTPTGYLKVVTSPAVPGTITIDNHPADDWGVYTDLPTGTHQVCFGAVTGHTTPACQTATVTAGTTTTITGTYT